MDGKQILISLLICLIVHDSQRHVKEEEPIFPRKTVIFQCMQFGILQPSAHKKRTLLLQDPHSLFLLGKKNPHNGYLYYIQNS